MVSQRSIGSLDFLRRGLIPLLGLLLVVGLTGPTRADTAAEIDQEVQGALERLSTEVPVAETLMQQAVATLVFPRVLKGGFVVGGQYGEGALLQKGKTTAYYNIASASFGLQAGAQAFDMVLLLMNDEVMTYLDDTEGFELGIDAGFVVADLGEAADLTTTTVQNPVIAFVFGERGLMAGISIEGSKITKVQK